MNQNCLKIFFFERNSSDRMRVESFLTLLLLMVAVLGAKSQSATTGRDSHEVPIDETWETTKGDMLINLVNALENDAIPAARNLVRIEQNTLYLSLSLSVSLCLSVCVSLSLALLLVLCP
jgi:hypothetical protein